MNFKRCLQWAWEKAKKGVAPPSRSSEKGNKTRRHQPFRRQKLFHDIFLPAQPFLSQPSAVLPSVPLFCFFTSSSSPAVSFPFYIHSFLLILLEKKKVIINVIFRPHSLFPPWLPICLVKTACGHGPSTSSTSSTTRNARFNTLSTQWAPTKRRSERRARLTRAQNPTRQCSQPSTRPQRQKTSPSPSLRCILHSM